MADLDVSANIQNVITAYENEKKQIDARIDYLSGVSSRLPSTVEFHKRWDSLKASIMLMCVTLCSPADCGVAHSDYHSLVVIKKHGSDRYTWFITIKAHGILKMIRIPENFPTIPFQFSAESDGFLRFLASEEHIVYYQEYEPIVLTYLNNMAKHGSQPMLNSKDYQ
jgi:hypothetical protein